MRRSFDGQVFYYALESPGQVAGLVDASNQVVAQYQYSPWGELLSQSGTVEQPLRYGAREYDSETGLYFLRARYYDPQLGRFISEDPIGLEGGINPYVYVGNDPLNGVDPYGLAECRYSVVTMVLPEGEVTMLVPSAGCKSGASANFGNPNARGGTLRFGGSGEFAGVGAGGTWRHSWEYYYSLPLEQQLAMPWTVDGNLTVCPPYEGPCIGVAIVAGLGPLRGFTKHGINSAISHDGVGVASRAILSAIKNPQRVVRQTQGRVKYIGQDATVVLNAVGKVITTWARNSGAWRIHP